MNASWATAETVNAKLGEVVLERADTDSEEDRGAIGMATRTILDATLKRETEHLFRAKYLYLLQKSVSRLPRYR
jgi:hypothetical protein